MDRTTQSEEAIMNLLWKHGSLSIMQPVQELEESKHWSKQTIVSFLRRMEEKGTVKYEQGGRTSSFKMAVIIMKRQLNTKTSDVRKKCTILLSLTICLSFLIGCQNTELSINDENDKQQMEYAEINQEKQDDSEAENIENIEAAGNAEINDQTESEPVAPTKEEVLSMRELVLEGMSEEEINRLTENIKIANLQMERAYLYDNIFAKLEDPESLYWNYFDNKGDIKISETETVYNRFHAENFINLLEEMKATVQNEALRNDLQQIIDQTALAAETHEMEYANNIYRLLHDMDYFLLRYGPEDVGKYTQDQSLVSKYCGVLSVYN